MYQTAPLSFTRGCRFTALLRSVLAPPKPEGGTAEESSGSRIGRATSLAEQVKASTRAVKEHATLGYDQLMQAVVEGGRGGEFAEIILVYKEDGGSVRDVTQAEAESDALPAEVFAQSFFEHLRASPQLTNVLMGLPPDWTYPSQPETETA